MINDEQFSKLFQLQT